MKKSIATLSLASLFLSSGAAGAELGLSPGVLVGVPGSVAAGVPVGARPGLSSTVVAAAEALPMPDQDGDGIADSFDNCLLVANPRQGWVNRFHSS